MKNIVLVLVAAAGLGALGTTPAYASGGGGSFLCDLPIIGKLLCPPPPGSGHGGGGTSVPEPATLAVLGAGAAAAIAAKRRRRRDKK